MNIVCREPAHASRIVAACVAALGFLAACAGGVSGHAPGLAGQQTQDPGTLNFPLAYVKRPPPVKDIDARDLITSTTGGDLYLREQASAGSAETNITAALTKGMGDVRDLDVSVDGKKLIFSLRPPLDPGKPNTDPTQPTWKIYEYDAGLKTVTQLTNDNTVAGHDVGAHYLPDGRIVFASTRQTSTRGIELDEGRPEYPAQTDDRQQPIFLLHVMNADGSNIHQISFNTNHDFAPSVLSNGQIVFSRYESVNGDQISLYRVNPDGTGLELYYGANSHATGADRAGDDKNVVQFLNARQRGTDSQLIALVRPFAGTQLGGDLVRIDGENFVETNQSATFGGPAGPGQVEATVLGVTTDSNMPSLGGRFASAYPLYDGTNRMLVSWSPCLVRNTSANTTTVCTTSNVTGANATPAPPQYTVWIYDMDAGTLSPLIGATPGIGLLEPVILQARVPRPQPLQDNVPTGTALKLAQNTAGGLGVLEIRSVYDFDHTDTVSTQTAAAFPNIATLADPKNSTADQRPARFLRVEKAVEIPDRTVRQIDNSAFGPTNMGMREILAYAPIEPDGSVHVQLPANVPFTIEVLDKNARRIGPRHTSWMQLMPGETKTCYGCHTAGNPTTPSHGRFESTASIYAGAAVAGTSFYPDTNPNFIVQQGGQTMADVRAQNTCANGTGTTCSEFPSIEVIYRDVWTDPGVTGRPADAPFAYLYANLTGGAAVQPNNAHCPSTTDPAAVTWDPLCRSTIHYPNHIQAIWKAARTLNGANATCVICHNVVDPANMTLEQVPQGQLDLTDTDPAPNASMPTVISYQELVIAHDEQTLNNGVPVFVTVPGPTGAPGPVALATPMTAGSAIGSQLGFFSKFDGTDHGIKVDHTGFLTTAELRLISEWLDIGAQYYNDPFVAPATN
jgi:hypothetical protein